jgi:hypothetical protein
MYTQTVMDHFKNPRNVGVIEGADGVGEVGNPVCGDMMTFYIKVKDDKLEDRDFVRIELWPTDSLTSKNPNHWIFNVDEKSTLPEWFKKTEN